MEHSLYKYKWLHLDLTWDDPVSLFSNVDNLIHKFYLIDTETLENYNIEDHNFDKYVYQEVHIKNSFKRVFI